MDPITRRRKDAQETWGAYVPTSLSETGPRSPTAPFSGPGEAREIGAGLAEGQRGRGETGAWTVTPRSHRGRCFPPLGRGAAPKGVSIAVCWDSRTRASAYTLMILPQVHLRKPCYDFYFL